MHLHFSSIDTQKGRTERKLFSNGMFECGIGANHAHEQLGSDTGNSIDYFPVLDHIRVGKKFLFFHDIFNRKILFINSYKLIFIFQTIAAMQNAEMKIHEQEEIEMPVAHEEQQLKPLEEGVRPTSRKKFGNMIHLFAVGNYSISLGPDYLFFFPTFLAFCALSYWLYNLIDQHFTSNSIKTFTFFIGVLQCTSYFLVAFSDPGIVRPNPDKIITKENKGTVCGKCGADIEHRSYHCSRCDVCIRGYDHHCPWTSKCIGEKNLCQFYFFLVMTPIYFLCLMGLIMGAGIQSATKHHIRTGPMI